MLLVDVKGHMRVTKTSITMLTLLFFASGVLPIYNCCTSNQRAVTMEQIIDIGKELQHEAPMEKVLWLPGGGLTRWRLVNYIRGFYFSVQNHFISVDFHFFSSHSSAFSAGVYHRYCVEAEGREAIVSKTCTKSPSLNNRFSVVNLQRKIYHANLALNHFILNKWDFENKNFTQLSRELKLQDLKAFYFNDFLDYDMILYFRHAVFGARRYLMKEKDETIERCRKKNVWLYYLDAFVRLLFYGSIFYFLFIKCNLLCITSTFCNFVSNTKC